MQKRYQYGTVAFQLLLVSCSAALAGHPGSVLSPPSSTPSSSPAASTAPTGLNPPTPFTAAPEQEKEPASTPSAGTSSLAPAAPAMVPVPGAALSALRGPIEKEAAPTNSVESFFQCAPVSARQPGQSSSTTPKAVPSAATAGKKFSYARALWHVMDNIGVPMFFGNHSSDLDPSLQPPAEQLATHGNVVPRSDQVTQLVPGKPIGSTTDVQGLPQKIPASELEGVELPTTRDLHATTP